MNIIMLMMLVTIAVFGIVTWLSPDMLRCISAHCLCRADVKSDPPITDGEGNYIGPPTRKK